jgi:hypothetical protein
MNASGSSGPEMPCPAGADADFAAWVIAMTMMSSRAVL